MLFSDISSKVCPPEGYCQIAKRKRTRLAVSNLNENEAEKHLSRRLGFRRRNGNQRAGCVENCRWRDIENSKNQAAEKPASEDWPRRIRRRISIIGVVGAGTRGPRRTVGEARSCMAWSSADSNLPGTRVRNMIPRSEGIYLVSSFDLAVT